MSLLPIVLLILILGGGGVGWYGGRTDAAWGPYGYGVGGFLVVVLVVLALTGRL
jgi:hypothetical protein